MGKVRVALAGVFEPRMATWLGELAIVPGTVLDRRLSLVDLGPRLSGPLARFSPVLERTGSRVARRGIAEGDA